jgi:hypothetical protein
MFRYVVVVILALIASNVFAEQNVFPSPDGEWTIVAKCNDMGVFCKIWVESRSGKKVWIDKEGYPRSQGIKWVGNHLVSIDYSYGTTPFFGTFFFSPDKGLSKIFEYVIAVNVNDNVVAVAEPDKKENSVINIYDIFGDGNKPFQVIRRDFKVATWEVDAIFIEDGSLQIEYSQGKDSKQVKEVIKINYKR